MPTNAEDYVHRIGRTGRAGAEGVALSLMEESEQKMFEAICKLTKQKLPLDKIEGFEPRWMRENAGQASAVKLANDNKDQDNKTNVASASSKENSKDKSRANVVRKLNTDIKTVAKTTDERPDAPLIKGRRRRGVRHQRQTCALLQANFGVNPR